MAKFKIAILFSDTGGGHRSAAEAIEAAILELLKENNASDEVAIYSDSVIEKSTPVNRFFVELYNFLLRHSQQGMKYYYQFIETFKPNDTPLSYWTTEPFFHRMMRNEKPTIVVSVHPMLNQIMASVLKKQGLTDKVKLITVVTDPNGDFWSGWASPSSHVTVAPNELALDRLISLGINPEQVKVLGMPVHPDFIKPPTLSPSELKRSLGLDPDGLTVCINAGWAGGGNMLKIYRALSDVKRPIQIVFLCGHNNGLYEKALKEASASSVPTAVLPFHDRMADMMSAVDLMVTKAGGLTTFEAVARRLPLAFDVITEPMPQERGTVDLLCQQGLAYKVAQPSDIVSILNNLNPVPVADRANEKLPHAYSLDRTDAVYEIAKLLLGYHDRRYLQPASPKAKDSSKSAG